MNWKLTTALFGFALMAGASTAQAEGELNLFNWGNYTSPEMIKKFEDTHKVKVTITDYDSNDTALAKVRAGGHGFDMAVPSGQLSAGVDRRRFGAGGASRPNGEFQEYRYALGRCSL